jgi:hypothetical protein
MGRLKENLTGKKFNNLLVKQEFINEKRSAWVCECACSKETVVFSSCLKNGTIKSCGCLVGKKAKHSKANSSEYGSWRSMKYRCSKPIKGYENIKVCERWNDFSNFYKDMGDKPSLKHTLDRIDTYGNYDPSNCRWVLMDVQQANRTNNKWIIFNNLKMIKSDWARFFNISFETLTYQMKIKNFDIIYKKYHNGIQH